MLEYVETWDELLNWFIPTTAARCASPGVRGAQAAAWMWRSSADRQSPDRHPRGRPFSIWLAPCGFACRWHDADVTAKRAAERSLMSHRDRLEDEVLERTAELVAARKGSRTFGAEQGPVPRQHESRDPYTAECRLGLSQIGIRQSQNRAIANTFEQIIEAGNTC